MAAMSAQDLSLEPCSQLFRNLDDIAVTSLQKAAQRRRLLAGEFFCRQRETVAKLYLLEAGLAKASRITSSGKEVLLDWVYPGDAFGMEALLSSPMSHAWSVCASETSGTLEWDRATLASLGARWPLLSNNIFEIIVRRNHQLQERFTALATEMVEPRLARLILQLARTSRNHGSTDLHISDEELAQMTGTSLFTVSRLLNRWQRLGHVEKSRRRLMILHVDKLSAVATNPA
jgi:CRP-like cAMP-binding protein